MVLYQNILLIISFWTLSTFFTGFLIWLIINKGKKIHPFYIPGIGLTFLTIIFSSTSIFANYSLKNTLFIHLFFSSLLLIIVFFLVKKNKVLHNLNYLNQEIKKITINKTLLIILILSIILAPTFILNLPMSTDAQGFSLLSVAVKNGGTIDSLSPFREEIKYIYSPAFFILTAYSADLFKIPAYSVLLILGHFFTLFLFLNIFLLGYEIKNEKFALLMLATTLITLGLFKSLLSGHYPRLLGLSLFALFSAFYVRTLKQKNILNMVLAGLTLGAIALVNPTILTHVVMAIIFFFIGLTIFKKKLNVSFKEFLVYFISIPLIGILISSPWLLKVKDVFSSTELNNHVASLYSQIWVPNLGNIVYLTIYQGGLVTILAIIGLVIAFKKLNKTNLFFIAWFIAVIDISLFGLSLIADEFFGGHLSKYIFPPAFAWVASIIPLIYFASITIDSFSKTKKFHIADLFKKIKNKIQPKLTFILIICISAVFLASINFSHIDNFAQKFPPSYGEFASPADIEAYLWLKENTPENSLIFNYIQTDITEQNLVFNFGNYESRWISAISEREAIHMPTQPSFINKDFYFERLFAGQKVYLNPKTNEFKEFIITYDVDYIAIPQFLVNKDQYYEEAYRWKKTDNSDILYLEEYDSLNFLTKIYNKGAIIYKVENI